MYALIYAQTGNYAIYDLDTQSSTSWHSNIDKVLSFRFEWNEPLEFYINNRRSIVCYFSDLKTFRLDYPELFI